MAKTPTQPGTSAVRPAKGKAVVEPSAEISASAAKQSKPRATAQNPAKARPFKRHRDWFNAHVGRPTASYYWIIGTTVTLTIIGRMTVLSASTAETISEGKDPYGLFIRESQFAVGGMVLMFILSCMPSAWYKKLSYPLMGLAILLLALIFTPMGVDIAGNKNWLEIGPVQFQPSEAAKLALAIWMGAVLATKGRLVRKLPHVLFPVGLGAGLILGLILFGKDMGTAIIVGMMVLAGLAFAGVQKRFLALALVLAGVAAALLSLFSSNRTSRFSAWLGDCSEPGVCDQYLNGMYALASGGWFGVGLGQSRQKWNWIPEAHNDFIFAIIGEEFGLLGTLVIVGLYGVLAFAIFRVINTRNDPFSRIVCGMILTWIIGQAVVNIAVVVGLLPVIGVPLPLISYGGTALIMVLAALGVVLSFSRTDPESTLKTS